MEMKDQNKMGEIEENIRKLFNKLPSLKKALEILEENEIKYGIFAGTCVYLLTSNREPTDVDFLVSDGDFEKLSGLFQGQVKKRKEKDASGEFFYLNEDRDLEFVSRLDFIENGGIYPIRLTPLAWKNVYKFRVDKTEVIILNPVDTILEKAIAPRGKEVGKHDLEDIEVLVRTLDIDKDYLLKRAEEMKAKKQVASVLKKFNLI